MGLNKDFRKLRLLIILIHNKDFDRLAYVQPQIKKLSENLSRFVDVEYREIFSQTDITPVSKRMAVYREYIYWNLNRGWTNYRLNKNVFICCDILFLLLRTLKRYVFKKQIGERWRRSSSIEMIVSDKHIRAIQESFEIGSDYLLVFEDDVVFKDDSISRFVELISDNIKQNDNRLYIDLAGGCKKEELKVDNLILKEDASYIIYTKPVTNTACSYLINKKQIETFQYYLVRDPSLRLIGIDWMFNQIFIFQKKDGLDTFCMHASPHIFSHGSAAGDYHPWQR